MGGAEFGDTMAQENEDECGSLPQHVVTERERGVHRLEPSPVPRLAPWRRGSGRYRARSPTEAPRARWRRAAGPRANDNAPTEAGARRDLPRVGSTRLSPPTSRSASLRSGASWRAAGVMRRLWESLKQQLAFDAIPSHNLQANALWQQLSVLTHKPCALRCSISPHASSAPPAGLSCGSQSRR